MDDSLIKVKYDIVELRSYKNKFNLLPKILNSSKNV